MCDEFVQPVEDAEDEAWRQRLHLVQQYHAARHVVQLAASRRLTGKQPLEELHARRNDYRRIPVLGGKVRALLNIGSVLVCEFLGVKVGVVLDDRTCPKSSTVLARVLFDDARVRNDHDDACQVVDLRVTQGERHCG